MPIVIDTNTVFPVTIRDVTHEWDGLMTAADKIKLDSLSPGGGGTLLQAYEAAASPADNTLPFDPALGGVIVYDEAGAGAPDGYLGVMYGAGAQELFMVRDSGITSQWDSFGTATTLGIFTLANITPAANGEQQYSPDIRLRGRGWAQGPGASRPVDFHMQVEPIQGVANPTGQLSWRSRINSGAANQVMTLSATGDLTAMGSVVAFGSDSAGHFFTNTINDDGGAVAFEIDSDNTWTVDGAKILLLSNAANDIAAMQIANSVWQWDVTLSGDGDMKAVHYLSAGPEPSVAVTTAGWVPATNGTIDVTAGSTDEEGIVELVGNTGLTGVNWFGADTDFFEVTLARAYPNGFTVSLSPANNATGALWNQFNINQGWSWYATAANKWVLHTSVAGPGLINGTTYRWAYQVRGH